MAQITITKAKLLKNDHVEIDYRQKDSSDSKAAKCSYEHDAPPRKEFKEAFQKLSTHAAIIGEYIAITDIDIEQPDPEKIKDFNVSGFTVVGEDKDEGVILTAQKTLKSQKILTFNTPTVRFNDESENAYPYLNELQSCIAVCKERVRDYLNGQHADDPQTKLEL